MTEENRKALEEGQFSYAGTFELAQGAYDSSYMDAHFSWFAHLPNA